MAERGWLARPEALFRELRDPANRPGQPPGQRSAYVVQRGTQLLPAALDIADVAPREVCFQAETLFKKANRLSFEHTREVAEAPPRPVRAIAPADR